MRLTVVVLLVSILNFVRAELPNASLTVNKTGVPLTQSAPGIITWNVTVENTGDVALTNVNVTDSRHGDLGSFGILAPGGLGFFTIVETDLPSGPYTDQAFAAGYYDPENLTIVGFSSLIECVVEPVMSFDFGTATSPVSSGYTRVTESTVYSVGSGYGWADTSNVGSRDRGAPDSLRRDLVFSSSDRSFYVDLANGEYTVKLIVGDNNYMHDNIDVYAEGALKVNDLTVSAGSFLEQTFGVVVSDGQLNLMFADDGGTDVNWVINAIEISPGPPPFWRGYDFGTASSPLEPGYIRISHYKSRDRVTPDNNLRRDFIFDSSDATFVPWDIPNGDYVVTVTIGDQKYRHDNIDVYAEGALKLDDVTVEAGQFKVLTFTVTLSDGELNIRFHDDGGTDENWIVNAITIESIL